MGVGPLSGHTHFDFESLGSLSCRMALLQKKSKQSCLSQPAPHPHYSHAVDCRWLGPCPQHYLVFPKTNFWLGASVHLLGWVSSHLLHMSATFESIFRRWQCFQTEQRQQELLRCATGTLHCNDVTRLADMWRTYQAIALFRGTDGDVEWDM